MALECVPFPHPWNTLEVRWVLANTSTRIRDDQDASQWAWIHCIMGSCLDDKIRQFITSTLSSKLFLLPLNKIHKLMMADSKVRIPALDELQKMKNIQSFDGTYVNGPVQDLVNLFCLFAMAQKNIGKAGENVKPWLLRRLGVLGSATYQNKSLFEDCFFYSDAGYCAIAKGFKFNRSLPQQMTVLVRRHNSLGSTGASELFRAELMLQYKWSGMAVFRKAGDLIMIDCFSSILFLDEHVAEDAIKLRAVKSALEEAGVSSDDLPYLSASRSPLFRLVKQADWPHLAYLAGILLGDSNAKRQYTGHLTQYTECTLKQLLKLKMITKRIKGFVDPLTYLLFDHLGIDVSLFADDQEKSYLEDASIPKRKFTGHLAPCTESTLWQLPLLEESNCDDHPVSVKNLFSAVGKDLTGIPASALPKILQLVKKPLTDDQLPRASLAAGGDCPTVFNFMQWGED